MKNEYCITWKLYRTWAIENMLKGVQFIFLIIWSIFGLALLCLGFFGGFNLLYILFAAFCFYRAVLRNLLFAKKQYKALSTTYGKENWTRTITFEDDQITLTEGPISIQYKYTDIINIKEKNNKIWLIFNNITVIRLYKTAFINTDWTACQTQITAKRTQKQPSAPQ